MLRRDGGGQRLGPLVCGALARPPLLPRPPHQCSITTLASSTSFWLLAGFSRFSAAAASAASAFRFLPREAMAPGARLGTEPTWGGNRVETRPPRRGQPSSKIQTATHSALQTKPLKLQKAWRWAPTWPGGGAFGQSHSARRDGGGRLQTEPPVLGGGRTALTTSLASHRLFCNRATS